MKRYITIDGGTTNTRLYLVENGKIIDTVRLSEGSNSKLSRKLLGESVKRAVRELLSGHSLSEGDVCRIIASGMITSEFGLYKLDHTVAPAGVPELKSGSVEISLPEISSIPFVFICGVKTAPKDPIETNMMRGEETELMGILDGSGADSIYVLPGSHTKLIRVDECGRILDFKTTLTGEMIAALSAHTLLSTCIDLSAPLDTDALFSGYLFTEENGINESLIKTRTLKTLLSKSDGYVYSFFLGSILYSDVRAIMRMPESRVVIGGREEIRHSIATLLKRFSDKEVEELSSDAVAYSTPKGAIKIYEHTV